jgi:hypothetical protein
MPEARRGRPEAAAAIWTSRIATNQSWASTAGGGAPRSVERPASSGRARLRGLVQAAAGAAVGTLVLLFVSRIAGTVVLTIAGLIGLAALLSPLGLFAAIERLFASLGHQVGRALTWILLPGIFYLFFVPFGALFRRGRRDAMKRFFEADAETYWKLREAPAGASEGRYRP